MSIHTPGVLAIARERQRQIIEEGWSPAHDAHYTAGELELAACCYAEFAAMQRCSPECAAAAQVPPHWPFDAAWWKPGTPVRNLERAGALIAAALDQHYSAQGRHLTNTSLVGQHQEKTPRRSAQARRGSQP